MQDLNKKPTLPCDAANPNPNPSPDRNPDTKPTLPYDDARCIPVCCWLQPHALGASNPTCQGCNPRYEDASFDVVTLSLSVDYMTSPLELFGEIHRVLRPGGLACMAFTNRCFPTKVVPAWNKPFTEPAHAQLVASYFRYAQGDWSEVVVADVSPDGWTGQKDPAIVVVGRK